MNKEDRNQYLKNHAELMAQVRSGELFQGYKHDESKCDREEFCLYKILAGLLTGNPTPLQVEVGALMVTARILGLLTDKNVAVVMVAVPELTPEPEEGGGGSIH